MTRSWRGLPADKYCSVKPSYARLARTILCRTLRANVFSVDDGNGQLCLPTGTFFCLSLFMFYVLGIAAQTYRQQVPENDRLLDLHG